MCAAIAKQKRILVVDDDLDLLMVTERRLVKEGYEVETAASIPEAEEYIYLFEPNLVLLDINVGGDDGRKLSMKMKLSKDEAHIKVLMMSGYDMDSNRALLFGADEMLVKPLNTEYLLYRIAVLLGEEKETSLIDRITRRNEGLQ